MHPGRRADGTARRSVVFRVVDAAVLITTVALALLLLCSYLARYVDPRTAWFFAFAGLIAPALYIGNILTAIYWAVRWRRYFIIPVAAILIGVGYVSLFFRPFSPKSGIADGLTVLSYNVMGFIDRDKQGRSFSTAPQMSSFVRSLDPDILCLQEFQAGNTLKKEELDKLIGLPYNTVNFRQKNRSGGGWGVAIYSRYPVLDSGFSHFASSTNSSMWVDLLIGGDTLRVFNNHLQTTNVDYSDREYINNQEFVRNTADRSSRVRGILSKLKRNFAIRAAQADSISRMIELSPHKVIVCGDFNDTPLSYTYFKVRGDLADAFVEKGSGLQSNTFKGLFNMFRIDYVLHSREIECLGYATPWSRYSDHKAVVAGFVMPSVSTEQ